MLYYPSKNALRGWIKEFKQYNELHKITTKRSKYTDDQKKYALDYYETHGKNVSKTIRDLGYPCRIALKEWMAAAFPDDLNNYSKPRKLEYTYQKLKRKML